MPLLTNESAAAFANQFRAARLGALADAEAFDHVIHVIERLGAYLSKEDFGDQGLWGSLEKYRDKLIELAKSSSLIAEDPPNFRYVTTPVEALYDLVKAARNDALHQGAFARHLTRHAVELALIRGCVE